MNDTRTALSLTVAVLELLEEGLVDNKCTTAADVVDDLDRTVAMATVKRWERGSPRCSQSRSRHTIRIG